MNATGQHDSNYLFGGGSIAQGCGTYGLEVEGDPITKLTCTGSGDDPLRNYLYRDAAQDARSNFYGARHGSSITQNDEGSFIQESAFSIWYADSCAGSGSYTFEKDLCIDYLTQTLDACDTDDISHKHGGTLLDTDNCGEFNFHPQGFDLVACYPENEEKGYVSTTFFFRAAIDTPSCPRLTTATHRLSVDSMLPSPRKLLPMPLTHFAIAQEMVRNTHLTRKYNLRKALPKKPVLLTVWRLAHTFTATTEPG